MIERRGTMSARAPLPSIRPPTHAVASVAPRGHLSPGGIYLGSRLTPPAGGCCFVVIIKL